MGEYILEMRNVRKEFPGVVALDDISIGVKRGEIHALCGENGAGKSTLIKILSGVYPTGSYSGEVLLNGAPAAFENTKQSGQAGIATIYQELMLVKDLSVAENIFLGSLAGKKLVDWDSMYCDTNTLLQRLKMNFSPHTKVRTLGVGQQQLVEIAKSLNKKVDVLILDEPTSALTETETELLLDILDELRGEGVTCIYISHKLDEVFRIADSISVLRDGKMIGTYPKDSTDKDSIISLMVGRELSAMFPVRKSEPGSVVLEVKNFCVYDPQDDRKCIVENANFKIRKGEVLGISGLMGSGRTELISGIFGGFGGKTTGEVLLDGQPVRLRAPKDSIGKGIYLVSEDRKRYGLVLEQSVAKNITLSSLDKICMNGLLSEEMEAQAAGSYVQDLNIKAPTIFVDANKLSGGNQQKVVLAKCLMTQPKVIFLDEPTRGIDVLAKHEIYNIINRLVEQGVAVIMVSSELPEIMGMSDIIMVMCEGRLQAGIGANCTAQELQEEIMQYAVGNKTKLAE